FLSPHSDHCTLHSFPTRRSSDLHAFNSKIQSGRLFNREPSSQVRRHHVHLRLRLRECHAGLETSNHAQGHVVTRALSKVHADRQDRKSTRLNSSHVSISYAVFCL